MVVVVVVVATISLARLDADGKAVDVAEGQGPEEEGAEEDADNDADPDVEIVLRRAFLQGRAAAAVGPRDPGDGPGPKPGYPLLQVLQARKKPIVASDETMSNGTRCGVMFCIRRRDRVEMGIRGYIHGAGAVETRRRRECCPWPEDYKCFRFTMAWRR